MTKRVSIAALTTALLLTSACNTVQGLGQDIESVGRTGEDVISYAPAEEAEQDAQDAR